MREETKVQGALLDKVFVTYLVQRFFVIDLVQEESGDINAAQSEIPFLIVRPLHRRHDGFTR